MELPIAGFSLVRVGTQLASALPEKHRELGHGIGFGSLAAPIGSREILPSDLNLPPVVNVLPAILAFDAWILNEDRKLRASGGNPNALYAPNQRKSVLLIDHDNAFDQSFDPLNFRKVHLADSSAHFWTDQGHRADWTSRAKRYKSSLSFAWESLPEEWLVDKYGDPQPILDRSTIETILDRPFVEADKFWHLVTGQ